MSLENWNWAKVEDRRVVDEIKRRKRGGKSMTRRVGAGWKRY